MWSALKMPMTFASYFNVDSGIQTLYDFFRFNGPKICSFLRRIGVSQASSTLKSQLLQLVSVQEIDLKILNITQKKNGLPKMLKTLDDQLGVLKKKHTEKNGFFLELEKSFKQVLAAIEINQERMDRATKKNDNVTNNKEFQAAGKEVDQLKKHNDHLSTQKKDIGDKLEAAKKDASTLETEMQGVQAKRDSEAGSIEGQVSEMNAEIARLTTERNGAAVGISQMILTRYDRVRGAKAGVGIVPAVAGRCKGCNLMVPPQLFNQVLKGIEVHSCPSCHRIIFVPENPEKTSQAS